VPVPVSRRAKAAAVSVTSPTAAVVRTYGESRRSPRPKVGPMSCTELVLPADDNAMPPASSTWA